MPGASSAASTPACASEDLPTPELPSRTGSLSGVAASAPDHLDGFARSAEEEVAVGLGHGGEAAIGRGVPPQLSRRRAAAGRRVHQLGEALLGCRVRGDDPVQLPQERQPRRGLTFEQHEHDREVLLLHAAVERLVIFHRLPRAESLLADQQDEGGGLGDFLGKFREP